MSVDKMIRSMVQEEIQRALAPFEATLGELRSQGEVMARFAAAFGAPVRRGPGRPPKAMKPAKAVKVKKAGKGGRGRPARARGDLRGCAVQGCKRPARSKGYCSAHYQKYRMLSKTGRLPSDWVENASPGSVKNMVLPRGRAGARALAEAKKKN